MNKLALGLSALALLGIASVATPSMAGDMQDQGPIANAPALQAQAYAPQAEVNGDLYPEIARNQQIASAGTHIAASPRDVQIAGAVDQASAQ